MAAPCRTPWYILGTRAVLLFARRRYCGGRRRALARRNRDLKKLEEDYEREITAGKDGC